MTKLNYIKKGLNHNLFVFLVLNFSALLYAVYNIFLFLAGFKYDNQFNVLVFKQLIICNFLIIVFRLISNLHSNTKNYFMKKYGFIKIENHGDIGWAIEGEIENRVVKIFYTDTISAYFRINFLFRRRISIYISSKKPIRILSKENATILNIEYVSRMSSYRLVSEYYNPIGIKFNIENKIIAAIDFLNRNEFAKY